MRTLLLVLLCLMVLVPPALGQGNTSANETGDQNETGNLSNEAPPDPDAERDAENGEAREDVPWAALLVGALAFGGAVWISRQTDV